MKKQLMLALLLGVFCLGANAKKKNRDNTDFSGFWVLSVEKSEIKGVPQFKAGVSSIKITQLADKIIMLKSMKDSTGKEVSGVDTITFDGVEKSLKDPSGQVIHRSITRKWSQDGKKMNLLSKFSIDTEEEPVEFEGTEIWSLDETGKVLTITNETVIGEQVQKLKLVYTKQ